MDQERDEARRRYLNHLDAIADRAKDIPDDVLEDAIEEACESVRHSDS